MVAKDVLTLREAAEFLRTSERTLWSLVQDDKVPSFRVGNGIRFYRRELEQLGTTVAIAETAERSSDK